MSRIAYGLLGGVGVAASAAQAHYNTITGPGYSPDALTIWGPAALVVAGAVSLPLLVRQRRLLLASAVGIGIGLCEIATLSTTLDRVAEQAAMRYAGHVSIDHRRTALQARLSALEWAGVDTPRLAAAMAEKRAADDAGSASAVAKSCRDVCAAQIRDRIARAEQEVVAARSEIGGATARREADARALRDEIAALQPPRPPSHLASQIARVTGLPVTHDHVALGKAVTYTLGSTVLASVLSGMVHVPNRTPPAPLPKLPPAPAPAPVGTALAVVESSRRRRRVAANEAAAFVHDRLVADAASHVSYADLWAAYVQWCGSRGDDPLPHERVGRALGALLVDQRGHRRDRHGIAGIAIGLAAALPAPETVP